MNKLYTYGCSKRMWEFDNRNGVGYKTGFNREITYGSRPWYYLRVEFVY